MTSDVKWLDAREGQAWRTFINAHHELMLRLHRHLVADSGLITAEYEVLSVLSQHPGGVMSAQELGNQLRWEKSRVSHQVRRMQDQGLVTRDPNPADARSCLVRLVPAGRRRIEEAAPSHVAHVRREFIDLLTPEELEVLIAVNERVLEHLAGERADETLDEPTDEPAEELAAEPAPKPTPARAKKKQPARKRS